VVQISEIALQEWIWIALLGLAKRKREYTVDMFAHLRALPMQTLP
jgi:hypothetical protein